MKKAFPLTNIIRHTLIVFFMLTILLPLALGAAAFDQVYA